MASIYPSGLVVFFRALTSDNNIARSVHLNGREVLIGAGGSYTVHQDDYVVLDGEGAIIGCYPREFVSAILPIETTGPGTQSDANNPKKPISN